MPRIGAAYQGPGPLRFLGPHLSSSGLCQTSRIQVSQVCLPETSARRVAVGDCRLEIGSPISVANATISVIRSCLQLEYGPS